MLKSHGEANISVSDTHLYRQFNGTATNNPFTAHTMKNKTGKNQTQTAMSSQVYSSEPRVRKAGPPPRVNEARGGARGASNFVPIPELGIFTPDQHVLQNGTYAQHCHLREVNNNGNNQNSSSSSYNHTNNAKITDSSNKHDRNSYQHNNGFFHGGETGSRDSRDFHPANYPRNHHYHSNTAHDHMTANHAHASINSSFESSNQSEVLSAGRQPATKRQDYQGHYETQQPPQQEVYHSCIDISALPSTQRDFNSLKSNSIAVNSSRSRLEPLGSSAMNSEKDTGNSNKDHDFNTIHSDQIYENHYRSHYIENESRDKNRRTKEKTPRNESPSKNLDETARSHSLGDLSSGLTFSLVGQKKQDSLLSIATCPSTRQLNNDNSRGIDGGVRSSYAEHSSSYVDNVQERHEVSTKSEDSLDTDCMGDEVDGDYPIRPEGSSALQHIRDRLQKAVLNSQKKFQSYSQPTKGGTPRKALSPIQQGESSSSKSKSSKSREAPDIPKADADNWASPDHYELREENSHQSQPPRQQTSQSRHQYSNNQQRSAQPQQPPNSARYVRQYSAPESVLPPQTSSPKRRDSVETISSYQSALSDPIQHSVAPLSSRAAYSNVGDIKNGESSVEGLSSAPRSEQEKSPVKPKRSLPQVSLTETSERIKRFTEIMKSRVSNHSSASNSRNGGYSADGASSGSQCTPTRVSSVDSTASARSASRKSSIDGASDNETSNNNRAYGVRNEESAYINGGYSEQRGNKYSHEQNHVWGDKERSPPVASQARGSHNNNISNSGDNGRRDDRRPPPQSSYYNSRYENDVNRHPDRGKNQLHVQGNGLNPEDVPLPPGDRSSDSGQTSGTSNSYTGSVLDSGYTTNNDGENGDHYHYHHHHHNHSNINSHNLQQQPYHHHHHRNHRQDFPPPPQLDHHRPQYLHLQPQPTQQIPESRTNQQVRQDGAYPSSNPKSNGNKRRPPPSTSRHRSNLMNAKQFGSVQNISSAQAHGNPKDKSNNNNEVWPPHFNDSGFGSLPRSGGNPLLPIQANSTPRGPYSAREYSSNQNAQILNDVHNALMPPTGVLAPVDSNRQPEGGALPFKAATRRSWDYSDARGFGRVENEMRNYHRNEMRYRSTDVISYNDRTNPSRDSWHPQSFHKPPPPPPPRHGESNFRTVNASKENVALHPVYPHQQSQLRHHHPPLPHHQHHSSQHPSSEVQSHAKSLYHGDPETDQHQAGFHSGGSSAYNNAVPASKSNGHSTSQHPDNNHSRNTDQYKHANPPQTTDQQDPSANVKKRPVPISRSNRSVRGRTLPGGFRYNESDAGFGQTTTFSLELSLYHLTQKYDLSPLCLDLPKHLTLKDMANLKEFTVEISLIETLGVPSSPQGQAPKIGSPGSAFTPVKNEIQHQGPPTILKIKVLTFRNVWKEVEKHCRLGLVLEADILVEVNGWFCLGADVAYLQRIVENCQGAITLTVARPKESEEKRYKGQTPAERVKSLESEISRLDDIIHVRDEKIKEMTAAAAAASSGKQILSNVNGEMPFEGMVIGEDEYVV